MAAVWRVISGRPRIHGRPFLPVRFLAPVRIFPAALNSFRGPRTLYLNFPLAGVSFAFQRDIPWRRSDSGRAPAAEVVAAAVVVTAITMAVAAMAVEVADRVEEAVAAATAGMVVEAIVAAVEVAEAVDRDVVRVGSTARPCGDPTALRPKVVLRGKCRPTA